MNAINYRVSLDMFDVSSQITIKAKKGDSACKIHITLTKSGKIYNITEGCSATFSAKKADGNFVYNYCTIEGNTIVYDFAESIDVDGNCQVSACEGSVDCEVALYKGDKKLTSPHFNLLVDGTVYNGEEIHSTDMVEEFRVDQTYDPTSKNAQSGIAVAEAVANAGGGGSVDLSNYYTKAEIDNLDAVKHVLQDDETSVSLNSPVGNSYIQVNDNGDVDISSEENVRINGSRITLVGNPKENTDAATKGYVDGLVGNIETLLGGI